MFSSPARDHEVDHVHSNISSSSSMSNRRVTSPIVSSISSSTLCVRSPSYGNLAAAERVSSARNSPSSAGDIPRTSSSVALNHYVGNLSLRGSSGNTNYNKSDANSYVRHSKRQQPPSAAHVNRGDLGRHSSRRESSAWHSSESSR